MIMSEAHSSLILFWWSFFLSYSFLSLFEYLSFIFENNKKIL